MSKQYVNRLSYLSYSTIYSARGDIQIDLSSYACFGNILNRGYTFNKEHYEIYSITDLGYSINEHKSNLCLLDERGVKKHLMLARRLFPFEYSVESSEYKGYNCFKITIDLDCDQYYHKYLLTWVRYLWEFPYNIILNEALRMKHCYLNKESISNLFVLCSNCYRSVVDSYGPGHAINGVEAQFLKENELREKIKKFADPNNRHGVNDLYPYNWGSKPFKLKPDENSGYLEYWSDPKEFEERAKVYLQEYKKLKG